MDIIGYCPYRQKHIGQYKYEGENLFPDFGQGYYYLLDKSAAKECAVTEGKDGKISVFSIHIEDDENVIDLRSQQYVSLHWLGIVLENRLFDLATPFEREAAEYIRKEFSLPGKYADAVIGYTMNNMRYLFAKAFLRSDITYRQFVEAINLNGNDLQICLKNRPADAVVCDEEFVPANIWFLSKESVRTNTYNAYKRILQTDYQNDFTIATMMDKEMTVDDLRV